ncbi:ABC transporter permease [Paenibacillus sp. MBLB4367]|uniref:ABC transporter permease n=1 Tax=Paenibacillus sp. MBLB4367 TaxID=3384767 RepID=UPI0039081713
MITVGKLFWRRVREDWAFQWSVWRLAVDWVVALYVVIPALLFGGYHVYLWWKQAPGWFDYIPYAAVAVILYGWTRVGTIRYFVQEADQLVILHTAWLRRLMLQGVRYSIAFQAVTAAAVLVFLFPLLHRSHGLSWTDTLVLYLLLVLFKMTASMLRQAVSIRFAGFGRFLASAALLAAEAASFLAVVLALRSNALIGAAACVVLLAAFPWLLRLRLARKGAFHHDVERERTERMKYAAIMLGQIIQKKSRIARKRPLLFRSSNRLFRSRTQVNGLTELAVKSFFRSKANMKVYIQLAVISCGGIVAIPAAGKWMLWFGSGLLLTYYTKLYVRDVGAEPFLKLFRWQDHAVWEARKKAVFLIMLPGFLLIGAVLGTVVYPWWGALWMTPISAAVGYAVAETVGAWGK